MMALIAGGIFLFMGAIFALMGITQYNKIVSYDEQVDASWAQVETVLQRRFDLVPNLVNTVRGYADHEKELLTEVTALRSQWGKAQSVSEKAGIASAFQGALGRLMVVVERYPDLKANQNFLSLQSQLEGTENRISVERRRYNEAVRNYNTAIKRFPGVMVASLTGFEKRDAYFEAAEEAETAPVVEF